MNLELGQSIPPDTAHAVSVSLPTWKANIGYEEGEDWVINKMKNGYPRFFIHNSIKRFAEIICRSHASPAETAALFPSRAAALRCAEFLYTHAADLHGQRVRIVELVLNPRTSRDTTLHALAPEIFAVIFPKEHFPVTKSFWAHTGDGISSRRAEFCMGLYEEGILVEKSVAQDHEREPQRLSKGPKRYQRGDATERCVSKFTRQPNSTSTSALNGSHGGEEADQFVEERFGRNMDLSFVANAKLAIRKRIAGSLTADVDLTDALTMTRDEERIRQSSGFSEDDVYLYPTGMSSIFNTHRILLKTRGPLKSICFGFPYVDTLKILQKWGPGCLFYGHGSSEQLDDLELRLQSGERFLALFCEFPGNPLLKTPDLQRIRSLADKYEFAVVVDETIGNFLNVQVLPYADIVVSSLTKIFSGDSNVMGGSCVLNPRSKYYDALRTTLAAEYEDTYWAEDAIFMERNSRDFVSRIDRINVNAEAICDVLKADPRVKEVFYPKYSSTRPFYDSCRTPNGGFGGLLSATFYSSDDAMKFFDSLETAKGPSLGTNFTLCMLYTLLAHYTELEWAAEFGVEKELIRISVGLEDSGDLTCRVQRALDGLGYPKGETEH
ncbi:PLP-dependent transferase [Xylona heveae TC161]|uniref:cystathionine gamma-synthase n=1 Tax=Xylona heveae (strain CBS 132557 / TC161) TaxID=1328760 RepID=A0A164ZAY2_XYLHT|nr:PLP-dependent transferase [Xylona heveae TC161]KZF18882.1 PLP-dependent transferase [Xylona heveae TC161]